jgi:hypothetical protein
VSNSGLPLTSGQRAIWFDQLLHGDQPLYNMSGYLRILGPVDRERFETAVHELIRRNDALRIVLHQDGDLPIQEFVPGSVSQPVRYLDFSSLPEKEALALRWMMDEVEKAPRLLDTPLFDNALIKIADDEYWWFHTYHLIINDAYGHSLLVTQLAAIYSGVTDLPAYSYVDYIHYDRELQASERWAADVEYWAQRFATLPGPMIERKAFGERIEHRRHVMTLERAFYDRMNAFAAQVGVSTFHVILAGLYVCFTRATGREDFVIGLPTLNRPNAAFKATIGLFTNVTPAWFALGVDLPSADLLKGIAAELRRDYRHQRVPLSEINRRIGLYREGRPQMFDIVLTYQNHSYDVRFDDYAVEQISLRHGLKTPLMIEVSEYNDELDVAVNIDYSTSAFTPDEIEYLGEQLKGALGALLDGGAAAIRDLPISPGRDLRVSAGAPLDDTIAALPRCDVPLPELEAMLSAIWQEELGLERVGAHDNVFDLGGHSLSLVRVAHRVAIEIGCALTITQMFMYPTIHALATGLCGQAEPAVAFDAARERGAARRRAAAQANR